ncbi:substrate-binding periplasmic protein [Shewanella sp. MF05960]|uniref:substrate-binding periplasmic protein n=1 Tax=Shewanella sp. MF05960 TaxID=3434874 RepID=UPI003D79266A
MKFGIIFLLITLSSFIGHTVSTVTVVADPTETIHPSEKAHPLVDQHAEHYQQASLPSLKQISFSTSNSIAPYFFADKPQGVQYDLLLAALELNDIAIKELVHAPNLRAQRLVNTKIIDCMVNTPDNVEGMFYTQSLIEYQNSVFYLTKNHLQVNNVQDLKPITILGFQNAKNYLGDEFEALATASSSYSEISNQKSQVVMLFNGHTQSIVLERRIFEYYRHQLRDKLNTSLPVTEVALFAPAERKIACHDKHTAAIVDLAISTLKQSYRYQEILDLAEKNSYQPAQYYNQLTR